MSNIDSYGMDEEGFEIIKKYLKEISGPIPYVSRSHLTLMGLYSKHGKGKIDSLVKEYLARQKSTLGYNS